MFVDFCFVYYYHSQALYEDINLSKCNQINAHTQYTSAYLVILTFFHPSKKKYLAKTFQRNKLGK